MSPAEVERELAKYIPSLKRIVKRFPYEHREDLLQVAMLTLWQATKTYESGHDANLLSYSFRSIKRALLNYCRHQIPTVRIATKKNFIKLMFQIGRYTKTGETLSPEERLQLHKDLDVPMKDIREMEVRLNSQTSEGYEYIQDYSGDPAALVEQYDWVQYSTELIAQGLGTMSEKRASIITARRLTDDPPTLQELAVTHKNRSCSVSAHEHTAIKKLAVFIEDKDPSIKMLVKDEII